MRFANVIATVGALLAAGVQSRAQSPASGQRVVLVTGSTDGLGREVAMRTAATGAFIIVHGRNKARGDSVVAAIRKQGKGNATFLAADLASLKEINALADTVLGRYKRLDVLVNNAGILLRNGPKELSADGYELTMAVNYLAGYVLTKRLLPRLIESAPSRVINVSSQSQQPIDLDDAMQERFYSGQRGYGTSKLAQVMFTIDLAKELEGKRVTVVALHPASQMNTSMITKLGNTPRTTVDEGATAVMHLVTASDLVSGGFYNGLNLSRAIPQAYDPAARAKLHALSEQWSRLK